MLGNNSTPSMESLIEEDDSSSESNSSTDGPMWLQQLYSSWTSNLNSAEAFKEEGNRHYKEGLITTAIKKYHQALFYLRAIKDTLTIHEMDDPMLTENIQEKAKRLYIDINNNLAACLLTRDPPSYSRVLEKCDNALERQPDNIKALYRKGVALYHLGRVEQSMEVFEKIEMLSQDGPDPNVKRYLELCKQERNSRVEMIL